MSGFDFDDVEMRDLPQDDDQPDDDQPIDGATPMEVDLEVDSSKEKRKLTPQMEEEEKRPKKRRRKASLSISAQLRPIEPQPSTDTLLVPEHGALALDSGFGSAPEDLASFSSSSSPLPLPPRPSAGSVFRPGGSPDLNPPSSASSSSSGVDSANISKDLEFYFMDVGQGSGTLVICPNGEKILIDLGCMSDSVKQEGVPDIDVPLIIKNSVSPFLLRMTKGKLNYLIISHADQDHLNLLEPALKDYQIDKTICGGSLSQYKRAMKEWLSKKNPEFLKKGYCESEPNGKIRVESVDITIVAANSPLAKPDALREFLGDGSNPKPGTDTNASSIVLLFQYGGKKVIVAADATYSSELFISKSKGWNALKDSYALIGGHHGSADSFSQTWLRHINPSWVLFSADLKKAYAHPTVAVFERVLACTKLFNREGAFGPHGIVVGSRIASPTALAQREKDLSEQSKDLLGNLRDLIADELTIRGSFEPGVCLRISEDPEEKVSYSWIATTWMFSRSLAKDPPEVDPPWVGEIFGDVYARSRGPLPQDLVKLVEYYAESVKGDLAGDVPPLAYWAWLFQEYAAELERVDSLNSKILKEDQERFGGKGQYAAWHWLMLEANLFTTMETANSGVYWNLTIEAPGGLARTTRM